MINLFEHFNEQSALLYYSFKKAKINNETIVLLDDGFLPDDIITPNLFFAGDEVKKGEPKYFNEIDIPKHWSIESTGMEAKILDMNEERARIMFKKAFQNRIIEYITWFDKKGNVILKDYYSKYGIKFASQRFLNNKLIYTEYLSIDGQTIIYQNEMTQQVILYWEEKTHIFENKQQFYIYFLKALNIDLTSIIVNTLALPLIITLDLPCKGKDYLVYQEVPGEEMPGNMKFILEQQNKREYTIVVPDYKVYKKLLEITDPSLHHHFIQSGYLYNYRKQNTNNNKILIVTNTDSIENLEALIVYNKSYEFHITAITEMSSKLMNLGNYDNVKLYPNASEDTFKMLNNECDIYLDINDGNEILDSVKQAFLHNMLIIGYTEIAHNKQYSATEFLFNKVQYKKINELLDEISLRENVIQQKLKIQKRHANEVTKESFLENFSEKNKL